jgi:hypothetical protein
MRARPVVPRRTILHHCTAPDRTMARLLLNLRHVPDDERDEVTALLDEAGIDWYATRPSAFGVSGGGIWIRDDASHERAVALLDAYQAGRVERARTERELARREGTADSFGAVLRRDPLRVLLVLLAILGVLAFLAAPLWVGPKDAAPALSR